MPESGYTGTIDEGDINDLFVTMGEIVEANDEVGFMVTYHAPRNGVAGRVDVAGCGISNAQLREILDRVVEKDAAEGRCR